MQLSCLHHACSSNQWKLYMPNTHGSMSKVLVRCWRMWIMGGLGQAAERAGGSWGLEGVNFSGSSECWDAIPIFPPWHSLWTYAGWGQPTEPGDLLEAKSFYLHLWAYLVASPTITCSIHSVSLAEWQKGVEHRNVLPVIHYYGDSQTVHCGTWDCCGTLTSAL